MLMRVSKVGNAMSVALEVAASNANLIWGPSVAAPNIDRSIDGPSDVKHI